MSSPKIDLTLTPEGRHVAFSKEMLEKASVYRRVASEGSAWEPIAFNARSPFVDTAAYPAGTTLEYHVQCFSQQDQFLGNSHVVRTTIE